MSLKEKCFIIYIIAVSVISFFLVIIDKLNAIRGRRRIRESTMMIFSALGGSAVMYLSMNAFHHKTQKNKFVFGIPLIFAVQCIIIALAYKYGLG